MDREWFRGKRVVAIGAARTGVALADALVPLGAKVHVFDRKTAEDLPEAAISLKAAGAGVTWSSNEGPALLEADVIVPSPGVPRNAPVLQEAVKRGQTVWGEIEVSWRIARAPIAGITGTNGKTTTTALLGEMLADQGIDARVGGNIAPGIPLVSLAATAPEDAVLVAEISSFQLEWIQDFRPRVGIMTNITEDHLDRHHSMEEYAAAKARLFENQTSAEHSIVNADNPLALEAGKRSKATLWLFSRVVEVERGAFLRNGNLMIRDGEKESFIGPTRDFLLPGGHNVENAMAAGIAAKILGASTDNLFHTLTRFRGVAHRMESIARVDGVEYINNSMCTNPRALIESLRACERPVILIAGGRNKGLNFEALPSVLAESCRGVVTIGEYADEMAEMARDAGVPSVVVAGDLARAVPLARQMAQPDDCVLLAPGCASMDQFQDFQDRGDQFRAAVLELSHPAR